MARHGALITAVASLMVVGFLPMTGGAVPVVAAVSSAVDHVDLQSVYLGPTLGSSGAPGSCGVLQCYTPQEIQNGYDYNPIYNALGGYANAGRGETIVIFDAFGDPAVAENLEVFDQTFGLPSAHLNVICPQGCPALDYAGPNGADEASWAEEITLDTQYSHAMAPAATIDLVVSWNDSNGAMANAEQYALAHHLGNVWSQSFGTPECTFTPGPANPWFAQNNEIFQKAVSEGITIFASAGDAGAQLGCTGPSASYPADNPLNIAVTGTYLDLRFAPGANVSSPLVSAPARYGHETTWNDFENATLAADGLIFGVTGGAPSDYFAAPTYQQVQRVTPYTCTGSTPATCSAGAPYHPFGKVSADVAYDGGVDGGVLAYMNFTTLIPGGYYIFGGTSAGSPQWAAIAALADQFHHTALGDFAAILYSRAVAGTPALHDVTVGSNAVEPGVGFLATPGWDAASGLGSPNVAILVPLL